MEHYLLIKLVHVSAVVLSGSGFLLRGVLMLRESPWLLHPVVRRTPHYIDTALLGSALLLAWLSGQWPFVLPWVTAKVGFLLGHIVFGAIALYRGRTRAVRVACLAMSTLCFANIVAIALTRSPWGLVSAWMA